MWGREAVYNLYFQNSRQGMRYFHFMASDCQMRELTQIQYKVFAGLTIRENESIRFINQHWKGHKALITYEAELLPNHLHLCICRNHIEHLSSGNLSDLTQSMSKCWIYCFPCSVGILVKFILEIIRFSLDCSSSKSSQIYAKVLTTWFSTYVINLCESFNGM